MGVFWTDRLTGQVLGQSNRMWWLVGEVLHAVEAPGLAAGLTRDGYLPAALAQGWGSALFERLSGVMVVARPMAVRGPGLHPVGVYATGDPAGLRWAREGEQLSIYDTPSAGFVLRLAEFCTTSSGFAITTFRPPAPFCSPSEAAARYWRRRSGLLPSPVRSPRSRPAAGVPR